MFGDDSKLRLRKSHATTSTNTTTGGMMVGTTIITTLKSLDCEEGGGGSGSDHHNHNMNNNNNNNNGSLMSSLHGSGSSGLSLQGMDHHHHHHHHHNSHTTSSSSSPPLPSIGQIKGKRVRRRRRKVLLRYCRLCLSGMTATILSVTLSISLLPFSWVQVDYHHQVQHEFEYVYQVLVDNRRNYQTILRGIHHHEKQVVCPSGGIGFENDDYCDCFLEGDHGFDESKTSACSNRHTVGQRIFQCHYPHDTIWIFPSRVGDGIRDCPDGSDEL